MPSIGGYAGLPAMSMPVLPSPVSATVYPNTTGVHLYLNLICSVSPTVLLNSSVAVEISGDASSWTEVAHLEIPAGGVTLAGLVSTLHFTVPSGWSYRVTLTRATASALLAVG